MKKLLAVLVVAICLLSFGFAKTYITVDPYVDGCLRAKAVYGTTGFDVSFGGYGCTPFYLGWEVGNGGELGIDFDVDYTDGSFSINELGLSNDYLGVKYYSSKTFGSDWYCTDCDGWYNIGLSWFDYYDSGDKAETLILSMPGLGLSIGGQDGKLAMKGGWGFVDAAVGMTFDATKINGAYVETTINPIADLNVYAGFGADFDPMLYGWYAGASYAFDFDFLTVTPSFYWDSEDASGTVSANGPGQYAKVKVGLDFDPFTLSSWFKYKINTKKFSLEVTPELDMDWLFVGADFNYTQGASPSLAALATVDYDFTDTISAEVTVGSGDYFTDYADCNNWGTTDYVGNLLGADSFKDLSVYGAVTLSLPIGNITPAIMPFGAYYISEKHWQAGAKLSATLFDELSVWIKGYYDSVDKLGWQVGAQYIVCF